MSDILPHKLLTAKRGDVVDEEYFGFVLLYENFCRIKSFGEDNNAKFFLRSLSKPVQASLAADFDLLNLNEEQIALCCASHSGTNIHTALVRSILEKFKLDESYLMCPPAKPLDPCDFDGIEKPLYHNCSAKHALMLAVSKLNGWDLKSYCDIEHPVQKLIYKRHLDLSGANEALISYDGCGTPVFALSMDEIARMFFNLFNDKKYNFIKNAMLRHPYIAGGANRLDTEIMQLGAGNLVSKVGAGGFVIVYNVNKDRLLIVKMSQNNNVPRRLIVLNALYELGWTNKDYASGQYHNDWGRVVGDYLYNFSFL